jgi:hypothetical protein
MARALKIAPVCKTLDGQQKKACNPIPIVDIASNLYQFNIVYEQPGMKTTKRLIEVSF